MPTDQFWMGFIAGLSLVPATCVVIYYWSLKTVEDEKVRLQREFASKCAGLVKPMSSPLIKPIKPVKKNGRKNNKVSS